MPPLVSTDIYALIIDGHAEINRETEAKVLELMPLLKPKEREFAREIVEAHGALFMKFLREGSLDSVIDEMRELCRKTAQSEITFEQYVAIAQIRDERGKREVIHHLACQTEELVEVFLQFDNYKNALFQEYAEARSAYWRERELSARRLHQDFFRNLPFPAITGTPDLIIEDLNPAVLDCIKLNAEEVVGQHMSEWLARLEVAEADRVRLLAKFNETDLLVHEEIDITCPSCGQPMRLSLSMTRIESAEAGKRGFQAMIQDVSALKRMELQLANRKAQMDAVFDSTLAGLIFVDSNRIIQRINRRAVELLENPPTELMDGNQSDQLHLSIKNICKFPNAFDQLLEEVYSLPEVTRSGTFETLASERVVSYTVTTVYDDKTCPIGWLWVLADVTDRLAAENLKTDLTHMIVHDLKNPLTSIHAGASVLRTTTPCADEKFNGVLDVVQRNCDRMLEMIMNLLDIERLEGGKLDLDLQDQNISELLLGVIESQRHAAGERTLELKIDPGLIETRISIDASLIERTVTNLVSNAIKHTRPRDGVITLTAEPGSNAEANGDDGDNANIVIIAVSDNGAGIPAEFHEKIFQKFGQAEMRAEGRKTDTGLGLTFCKLAVEAHDGTIELASEPDKGSTFSIRLPRLVAADA